MPDSKIEPLVANVLCLSVGAVNESLAMANVEAWDSLKHMELVVALESTFEIELTFDEIVAMRSVQDIKRVLTGRGVQI